MRKYLTEFIGTFFLVLTVGLTVLAGTPSAPWAIGASLMVMVYMGGHISGGHYNPAVSLAAAIRGAIPKSDLVPYWVSQLLGGIGASLVVNLLTARTFAPAPGPGSTPLGALLAELLFTFALALVMLNTATSKHTTGNSYYGLAIGFTVGAGAFAAGGISGAAFNPAVGLGPIAVDAMLGGGPWSNLWIYLVGPLAGGALAAMVFKIQEPE